MACPDLTAVKDPVEPGADGCQDCLADGHRNWRHLRLCMGCGHVGCCDSSPGRHASAHAHAADHPVVQSFEPNEAWGYCYAHDVMRTALPQRVLAAHP